MSDPNLEILRIAVTKLGEISQDLVFVGGCTTGLFITDPAAPEVRSTDDVDTIVEATTYVEYLKFAERLESVGFRIDTSEGAPVCRWVNEETVLDVMPLDEKTLGFTNTWYRPAVDTSVVHEILPGVLIRVVSPVYFCATKLEAFSGRGNGDYLASHDLEDITIVVDGRKELVEEITLADQPVRSYISGETRRLLNERAFRDALPGYLLPDTASQKRLPILIDRLNQLANLK